MCQNSLKATKSWFCKLIVHFYYLQLPEGKAAQKMFFTDFVEEEEKTRLIDPQSLSLQLYVLILFCFRSYKSWVECFIELFLFQEANFNNFYYRIVLLKYFTWYIALLITKQCQVLTLLFQLEASLTFLVPDWKKKKKNLLKK